EQQIVAANDKIVRLGLQDRVTVEHIDYAKLEGSYDKIASIGMFEHVGLRNHPAYFDTIYRVLKPRGLYLHHAIARRSTSNDKSLRKATTKQVALNRYIFPGEEVDHLGMSIANLERHRFEVHDTENWREHYARTTRLWYDRLDANRKAAEHEVGS